MGTPNKLAQALRDAVIPMVSRLAPFQHAFVQRLSELGIAYRGSPIVEGAGKRYFDDSLRGGTAFAAASCSWSMRQTHPRRSGSRSPTADLVEIRPLETRA